MQTTQTAEVCHICPKEVKELFSPCIMTQSKGNETPISEKLPSCHTYWGDLSFPSGENEGNSKGFYMKKTHNSQKETDIKVQSKCSSNRDYLPLQYRKKPLCCKARLPPEYTKHWVW